VKSLPFRDLARIAATTLLALGPSLPVDAQTLPSEPISVGNGRLTIGGDVSATFSCAHALGTSSACTGDTGYFNFTDYEHSALRMLRVDVTAAFRATGHFSVLGEMRTENADRPQPYAFYLRIRPWTKRAFDIQVGRVPPTFGAFARRTYATDNILIGYPLAYQYMISLRPDALPLNADELLNMRGRGWLSSFSVGSSTPTRGVPLVSAFRWDNGVEIHAGSEIVDVAASVTTGTLAHPDVIDDTNGRLVSGRVALHPWPGLIVGASAARGPFPTRTALTLAGVPTDGSFTQTAWGGDIEYSRGYYLIRFETILSDWQLPIVASPQIDLPLRAVATSVEGRYKIRPGLYAAARADHLGFSEITGSTRTDTWEAPVTRVEIGGGYALQRNLELKFSFQHNSRDAGRVMRLDAESLQLVFWF
jgi:hypothetical protein